MNKKLLFSVTKNDCEFQYFRAGGPGGQKQNKTFSAVRCIHRPSGAVGECREERSQITNKRRAFKRMAESPKFQIWARKTAEEISNKKSIDEIIEEQMNEKNLHIEIRDENGKWILFSEKDVVSE